MSYDSAQKNELRAMLNLKGQTFDVFANDRCMLPEFTIKGVRTTRTKNSNRQVIWVESKYPILDKNMVIKAENSHEYWKIINAEEDMGKKKLIKRVYGIVRSNE